MPRSTSTRWRCSSRTTWSRTVAFNATIREPAAARWTSALVVPKVARISARQFLTREDEAKECLERQALSPEPVAVVAKEGGGADAGAHPQRNRLIQATPPSWHLTLHLTRPLLIAEKPIAPSAVRGCGCFQNIVAPQGDILQMASQA
jgi:hypothetical protein